MTVSVTIRCYSPFNAAGSRDRPQAAELGVDSCGPGGKAPHRGRTPQEAGSLRDKAASQGRPRLLRSGGAAEGSRPSCPVRTPGRAQGYICASGLCLGAASIPASRRANEAGLARQRSSGPGESASRIDGPSLGRLRSPRARSSVDRRMRPGFEVRMTRYQPISFA